VFKGRRPLEVIAVEEGSHSESIFFFLFNTSTVSKTKVVGEAIIIGPAAN